MGSRWKAQYVTATLDPKHLGNFSPGQDKELADPDGSLFLNRQINQASAGDAHTVLEEYRGYILDGGGAGHAGGHIRLDPARKEYLVEVDHPRTTLPNGQPAFPDLPAGGFAAVMSQAAGIFKNPVVGPSGGEKGAGIFLYYVFNEVQAAPTAPFTYDDIPNTLGATRDTARVRGGDPPNLRTDFVHLLFWNGLLGNFLPDGAVTFTPQGPVDAVKSGSFITLPELKAGFQRLVSRNRAVAGNFSDFLATAVAHELTHMLRVPRNTRQFDANAHTTDSDLDGRVNPREATPEQIVDPDDLTDLMYQDRRKENIELPSVVFSNALKRVLDVKNSDGLVQ